ncbi:MAG: sigma-70 family RNA polymerase sigma factor [Candidatus Fermentibacteraceae bacterium]|nr:sigma-70 family RNA polymerase sigma factor [Candidatus Fermentibacteraceae bacterium]MBN2608600.1 sigma-70 family RNA polymerase sigma factor [Candidatus Fermentibacteraceae bacterium]
MELSTDRDLVLAALDGDLDAFGELVCRCRGSILPELSHLLGDSHSAEDVAQEAFLRAYLKLTTLKEPYNFGGWARQIARNIARNRLARNPVILPLEEHLSEGMTAPAPVSEDCSDPRLHQALVALSRLSPKLRETARLTYLGDYSRKQVALRLGVPVGTVKRRLWEGRERMKEEVLRMSRIGRSTEVVRVVPDIRIEELPAQNMEIAASGPGLYFGTVLVPGHVEVCDFFDYPGGILTQSVRTQVVRKVGIMGRECFEVLIEHSDCEPPEPNVLDYFHKTDKGFDWVMRTTADGTYPATRFMEAGEELFPLSYSAGEHEDYAARVVKLSIGGRDFSRCLAVFWGWEKGTPAESFYTAEGRQILHRRFTGPGAPESKNYRYDKLLEEERKTFRGSDYRLWYDTVLEE